MAVLLAGFGAFLVVDFVVTLAETLLFVDVLCFMAMWKPHHELCFSMKYRILFFLSFL